MIILDTNLISELMRPEPHPAVLAWVVALPPGRRRSAFEAVVTAIFAEELAGRVLPFDGAAAEHYARIVTDRRAAGAPIEGFDGLIAATAAAAGFGVATRDVGGFAGCGIEVSNPWQA